MAQISTSQLKTPPIAIDAEQSVLGALLIDDKAFFRICGQLLANDFYRREHRLIFTAIAELSHNGTIPDVVTVSDYLQDELESAGGLSYVGSLANNTPSSANVVAYAKLVKEKSQRRNAITALTNAVTGMYDTDTEVDDVVTECMASLQDLSTSARSDKSFSEV